MTVGPLQGGVAQPQAVLLQLQSLGHDGMKRRQQVFSFPVSLIVAHHADYFLFGVLWYLVVSPAKRIEP